MKKDHERKKLGLTEQGQKEGKGGEETRKQGMFEQQTNQRREGTRMQEGSKKKKEGNMEEKKEVKEKMFVG